MLFRSTKYYDEFDLNKVVKALSYFVSEDLSNWYIRRNRDRFWQSEYNLSKRSVYITTYEVLVGLSQIIAPITPFLAEEMYTKLTNEDSVHTSLFPEYDSKLINNELENKMDLVRNLISLGRMVREETKIKVRQPLSEIYLDSKTKNILGNLTSLIKEELNVKDIVFITDINKYMTLDVKPNFKEVGKVFGPKINDFKTFLETLNDDDRLSLNDNLDIQVKFDNKDLTITPNMVSISVNPKVGFNIGKEDNNYVILNTNLNESLINEGLAREIISKIQNIRYYFSC